jgi:hypothetical protein
VRQRRRYQKSPPSPAHSPMPSTRAAWQRLTKREVYREASSLLGFFACGLGLSDSGNFGASSAGTSLTIKSA